MKKLTYIINRISHRIDVFLYSLKNNYGVQESVLAFVFLCVALTLLGIAFIESSSNATLAFFGRSLDFMLVQDYQSALDDLTKVIIDQPDFSLAYFNRAIVRQKIFELSSMDDNNFNLDEASNMKINILSATSLSKSNSRDQKKSTALTDKRKIEFEMIMRDYDKVIEIDPGFVYAY